MAPDDHSGGGRPAGPVVLRIKLRYDDLDAMVTRFAANVGKSGLFLPTKSIQPIGTEVKFELRLANDAPVLVGLGKVKHVRAPDPANPKAAFGMAIELMRVSREGREVIIRMIERRRSIGLPDVAIPLPEDIDSARRADLESHPRADTAGIVREAMAQMASAPVAEQVLTARPTTGPIATAKLETAPVPLVKEATPAAEEPSKRAAGDPSKPAVEARAAEPATKERPSAPMRHTPTGQFAAARESGPLTRPAVPALAPEPARAKRPRVHELIAKVSESGPVLAAPPSELDMQVDLEQVLARARALAGGELDAELDLIREAAAAPVEITIDAASAELARQLGGTPITRRDRSARWAPPPAAVQRQPEEPVAAKAPIHAPPVDAPPVDAPVADAPVETISAPAAADTAVEPLPEPASSHVEAAPSHVEGVPEPVAAALAAPVDAAHIGTPADDVEDQAFAESAPGTSTAIEPEEVRRTFGPGSDIITEPRVDPEAQPEPIDEAPRSRPGTRPPAMVVEEDADLAAFERALDGAIIRTGLTKPAPPSENDDEIGDEVEELDSMDLVPEDEDASESTQIGAMPVDPNAFQQHGSPTVPDPLAEQLDAHLAAAEAEADAELDGAMRDGGYEQGGYSEPYTEQPGYDARGYEQQGYDANGYPQPQPYDQQGYDPQAGYPQEGYVGGGGYEQAEAPVESGYEQAPVEGGEEVSDFDVLAEADAEDADLLTAHGEQEASGESPAARPSEGSFDFAARLDLGDDDPSREFSPEAERLGSRGEPRYEQEPVAAHYAHRARSYDNGYSDGPPAYQDSPHPPVYTDYDAPSSSYTFAEPFPPRSPYDDPQDPYAENAPAQLTPIASPPVAKQPSVLRQPPADDMDLESALEALDVDLDELGGPAGRDSRPRLPGMPSPRAQREPPERLSEVETQRPPMRQGRAQSPPGGSKVPKAKRAATEDDGVLIDFDDED